ncbi:menin-like isoform X2 [Limulus polyphemus]|uniref:Menin n=1 Tax=Limulus polyphemus TaxID=6850 RepID=A0ABM1TPN0_LIMPO|nr:menin-like isoform X2 [Limulus polyphemus]
MTQRRGRSAHHSIKMAGFRDDQKCTFPLQSIQDVVKLFRIELERGDEPNLALLSIVVGSVENLLTCNRYLSPRNETESEQNVKPNFPILELSTVEALYCKFESQIKGCVDVTQYRGNSYASRELVKKTSDIIWSSLTRSYCKDRAHLQTLYSYLTASDLQHDCSWLLKLERVATQKAGSKKDLLSERERGSWRYPILMATQGNKLDCFGVAFAVVAACQILGYSDVHLALSEDHAWVIFGKDGEETAEVTWHGKGNEDKRGQPVCGPTAQKSWLYLNGHPVKCNRHTEVAALVSGINPSISATADSKELATLQQKLLWLLYDQGDLKNYPMAIGNLGDLEEINPTPGRSSPIDLFHQAIFAAQTHYANHHVYPYTYLGGFFYRNGQYKDALEAWANAADVIRKYNYGREDEEIYKEFLEIANDLIPHLVKVVSNQAIEAPEKAESNCLHDPQCFAHLLRFYDGLCAWEEESSTPVLHIGWARPLVATISKFPAKTRSHVDIKISEEKEEKVDDEKNGSVNRRHSHGRRDSLQKNDVKNEEDIVKTKVNGSTNVSDKKAGKMKKKLLKKISADAEAESVHQAKTQGDGQDTEFLHSLVTNYDPSEAPHPNIAALAAACSDNILNPDYLLGSGEPFSSRSSSSPSSSGDCRDLLSSQSNGAPFPGLTVEAMLKADSPALLTHGDGNDELGSTAEHTSVTLSSQKMTGLKELLLTEKLNTSAIQLQLTAQSQVQIVKRGRHSSEFDFVTTGRTTKRSRRE